MKTKRIERALRSGMKSAALPHRSALRVPMSRESFDAHVAPLASAPLFKSVEFRRGGADLTVKVFDPDGLRRSARVLRRALVAVSRSDSAPVRFSEREAGPRWTCDCAGCAAVARMR